MFNWRGKRSEEHTAAESIQGESISLMVRLASELKLHIVAGSITERAEGNEKNYNTSVIVGPDGALMGIYRKIHLFDVDLPGRVTVKESESKLPGTETVCVGTTAGAVGLSVCYDLRFPELLPAAGIRRRENHYSSELLHLSHWRGALGIAAACSRYREPDVRHRTGAIRSQRSRLQRLRKFDDRRSVGTRARARIRQ